MSVDAVLMTRSEYARHRGCDKALVTRWVKAGRIAVDAAGKIDAAAADIALGESRQRLNEPSTNPQPQSSGGGFIDTQQGSAGLTKHRTTIAAIEARTRYLQYEELRGTLVDSKQVAAAAASLSDKLVGILSLTGHAEDLTNAAGGADQVGVRTALKSIEFNLRAGVAEAFRQMVAEALATKSPPSAAPQSDISLQ